MIIGLHGRTILLYYNQHTKSIPLGSLDEMVRVRSKVQNMRSRKDNILEKEKNNIGYHYQ
jgi:hypothetical protein